MVPSGRTKKKATSEETHNFAVLTPGTSEEPEPPLPPPIFQDGKPANTPRCVTELHMVFKELVCLKALKKFTKITVSSVADQRYLVPYLSLYDFILTRETSKKEKIGGPLATLGTRPYYYFGGRQEVHVSKGSYTNVPYWGERG